jgi:hypothetical protein
MNRLYVSEIYTCDGWTPTILWYGEDFRAILENNTGGSRSATRDSRRVRRIKTQEELDVLNHVLCPFRIDHSKVEWVAA